jgi:hypothetical protein
MFKARATELKSLLLSFHISVHSIHEHHHVFLWFFELQILLLHPSFGGKIPNSSAVRRALRHASWHTALPSVTRHLGVPLWKNWMDG